MSLLLLLLYGLYDLRLLLDKLWSVDGLLLLGLLLLLLLLLLLIDVLELNGRGGRAGRCHRLSMSGDGVCGHRFARTGESLAGGRLQNLYAWSVADYLHFLVQRGELTCRADFPDCRLLLLRRLWLRLLLLLLLLWLLQLCGRLLLLLLLLLLLRCGRCIDKRLDSGRLSARSGHQLNLTKLLWLACRNYA